VISITRSPFAVVGASEIAGFSTALCVSGTVFSVVGSVLGNVCSTTGACACSTVGAEVAAVETSVFTG
jgi:hypothetical protein